MEMRTWEGSSPGSERRACGRAGLARVVLQCGGGAYL